MSVVATSPRTADNAPVRGTELSVSLVGRVFHRMRLWLGRALS
jgi:hypothetical protein